MTPGPVPSPDDRHWFNEGTHLGIYRFLGAHPVEGGVRFAVWAPAARAVSVIGDFNGWNPAAHPLGPDPSGIWHGFVEGAHAGALYKFAITTADGTVTEKSDPVGFRHETAPRTASAVWDLGYDWGDGEWMGARAGRRPHAEPFLVYEMHLGSWRRPGGGMPGYRQIADELADYLVDMGFTHVEFLPLTEHPFYGSWGYQTTGYFAPTSRYGEPQDLMALIDTLHRRGIGVILDWVPSHFATDAFALAHFDGTHLFEHADPKQGIHPDWDSAIFNYARNEVRSFLLSAAAFWFDHYHVDGLRVDAVASMLYLDYSRRPGEWVPNHHGGNENLEAIAFLRRLNEAMYARFPGVVMIAEESTAWPGVSRPTDAGGLGFGMKWDLGWMHDTLAYLAHDPVHRAHHHDQLTFRSLYAFHENFQLPLSHDEVVHGKGSLLGKMPGDRWQQFANLRLLLGYQIAQPGKPLLFMGGEWGVPWEWNHDAELDWGLLGDALHGGVQRWVRDLNRCLRGTPALFELDTEPRGFAWVTADDHAQSVIAFLRRGKADGRWVLAVFNFTPVPREDYRLGVPVGGVWRERLNSDARDYGGSGVGNLGVVRADREPSHGHPASIVVTVPPLAMVLLEGGGSGA